MSRDPSRRCDMPSSLGAVSRVVSAQGVKVDGVPRHVRDLRLAVVPAPAEGGRVLSGHNDDDDDDSAQIIIREQTCNSPENVARGETGETLFNK